MAYIPRSSLIPTEASGAIPVQIKKKRTIHAFGLIATIFFILSLLAAVGVFLYKDYLAGQLDVAREGLSAEGTDETARKIEEIKEYDDKLRIAANLLDNHISPSRIFEEIEDSTKKTVQFTGFELIHDPGFEVVVSLQGNGPGFASVALQKMEIFESEVFSNFVLQDITTAEGTEGEDGTVSGGGVAFKVTGVFDREVLRYTGSSVSAEEEVEIPTAETSLETDTNSGETTEESDAPVITPPLP